MGFALDSGDRYSVFSWKVLYGLLTRNHSDLGFLSSGNRVTTLYCYLMPVFRRLQRTKIWLYKQLIFNLMCMIFVCLCFINELSVLVPSLFIKI